MGSWVAFLEEGMLRGSVEGGEMVLVETGVFMLQDGEWDSKEWEEVEVDDLDVEGV